MRPKLAFIAFGIAAVGLTATVAHAAEPTTRTICLNGTKTIQVTPADEDTIGEPYTNGPCPTTTTGPGTTKPGTPGTTTAPAPTTTKAPGTTTVPPVRATPRFTG